MLDRDVASPHPAVEAASKRELTIGIDLDNTLVCYDELFHCVAREEGLIDSSCSKSKEKIRDTIRLLPDGERKWTRLQAIVYGPRMLAATAFPGAEEFLRHCAAARVRTMIVSHKTPSATLDGELVDLRTAAREWLRAQGFAVSGGGVTPADVYFESTRAEKVERIRSLGCTHFIDDLPEVFADAAFPAETVKLLFAPHGAGSVSDDVRVFGSWQELNRFFFDGR
jgi:hypothetical protein